jgi:Predicted oxidoreductases of the aldo/keto reductase family
VSAVSNWTQTAKERWGSKFLGIYYIDEVAGRQLDLASGWVEVQNATDYVDAANQFNQTVSSSVQWFRSGYSDGQTLNLFSSDYALYQFDYNAGYDVILAQLGWNYSRQLNIALCRGAATAANKDWGVIITWEYNQAPYLESGSRLYDDMVLAYDNGAKYITIFDSDKNYTQSVLTSDQLNAIKEFWQYAKEHPRSQSSSGDRVAFVLPAAYGYGFRGPSDSIWGLWPADAYSTNLSIAVGEKLLEYGESLDIVYNQTQLTLAGYRQLIYAEEITAIAT